MPEIRYGIGAAPGLAVAPMRWLATGPATSASDPTGADVDVEIARANSAFEIVATRYADMAEQATGPAAEILEMTAALAADPALAATAAEHIRAGGPTAHAATLAAEHFAGQLSALGGLMAERATDVRDVGNRVAAELSGVDPPGVPRSDTPFILAATDLAPADTATLDPTIVVGLLTVAGGPTSHTAILAKALGIPAVVGCADAAELATGTVVALDGSTGAVEIEPNSARRDELRALREIEAQQLAAHSSGAGCTRDGHPVALLANIGSAEDAAAAVAAGAEGVGLLRTEFLFLNAEFAPTVAEQTQRYAEIFRIMGSLPVTVRTLDAGSDKPLPFLGLDDETNPALGVRGIRLDVLDKHVLDNQLESIANASRATCTPVKVMAPMVATVTEATEFVHRARQAGLPDCGIMVELPAAALRAESIAAHVDFFSIGTNDLAQYLFGADRMSAHLAALHNPWQPALAAAIAAVVGGARSRGIPVGVCGEAASDPLFACVLVGLGVTSLSMAPSSLARVRAMLANVTLAQCRGAVAAIVAADTAEAAAQSARSVLEQSR